MIPFFFQERINIRIPRVLSFFGQRYSRQERLWGLQFFDWLLCNGLHCFTAVLLKSCPQDIRTRGIPKYYSCKAVFGHLSVGKVIVPLDSLGISVLFVYSDLIYIFASDCTQGYQTVLVAVVVLFPNSRSKIGFVCWPLLNSYK